MNKNDIKIVKEIIRQIEFMIETLSIYIEGIEEENENE